jgi:outer membrane protein insertion porin family
VFKRFFILTILLVGIVGISNGQVKKVKISSIVVEGNKKSEPSTIRLNSGLIVGKDVAGEDIQQALKNLWSLKLFSDIKILAANQTSDGIDLIIRVEEYPRLREIEIAGHEEIDVDDIEKEISVYRGMVVTPYKLFKIRKNIKSLYIKEGYLLADIKVDTITVEPGYVNITVKINEGQEVQIERITFHGNQAFDNDDLKGAMDETSEGGFWSSADFNEELYKLDLDKIVMYCKENGFRDAEIVTDSVSYSEDGKNIFIDVWIDEGPKYYFGDIRFSGQTIFQDIELQAVLDIQKGDVYNQVKYNERISEGLQKMYYNQGYLFAQVQPIEKPIGADTLDINFNISEGHVVSVKEINIIGNTKTHEKVIRREFRLQPGDVFNSSRLERSIRDISILNYFSNVLPNVLLIENDNQHVNLEVTVEEKSTDMANMSAGFSQRDGLIGSIGLAFNNFSLTHPFTGGDGQRLTFDWQFGRIYRSISVGFTEPWLFDSPTLIGFSVFNTRTGGGFYPWDRRDVGGSVHLGRRFQWPDNFFRGDWIARFSTSQISNIRDPELVDRYLRSGALRNIQQVSVTQIISRDSRNQPEFPTMGSVHSLSLQLAGGPLGGDAHYVKSIFSLEWFIPLPFNFVLFSKNKYGIIENIRDNSTIQFGEYFYLGGSGLGFAESLRGYDDGTVGPITATGSPIGGKSMVINSLELRFPIAPNPTIFGLFFLEGGNSWETIGETDPFNLRRSVGAGVRLFMPMIGIIGIDFGYGFDHYNALGRREGQWKVHFQFGKF